MEFFHIIRFIGAAMIGAGFLLGILSIAFFIMFCIDCIEVDA